MVYRDDNDSWWFISNITEQRKKAGKETQAKRSEMIKENLQVLSDIKSKIIKIALCGMI